MAKSNISENSCTDVSNTDELVQKRFKMRRVWSDVVFEYRRILSGKWAKEGKPEPMWEDALEDLLKSHPALKGLKPEME